MVCNSVFYSKIQISNTDQCSRSRENKKMDLLWICSEIFGGSLRLHEKSPNEKVESSKNSWTSKELLHFTEELSYARSSQILLND